MGGDISDTPGNFGKDYMTLTFKNGSVLDVVGALDSTRGGRRHCQIFKKKCRPPLQNSIMGIIKILLIIRREYYDRIFIPHY